MAWTALAQILQILSLVSLDFVYCNFYTDTTASKEACNVQHSACKSEELNIDDDGPSFIGRNGLVRLNGIKVGYVEEVDLGDCKRNRITKAMKPLMFEIPNFLSNEECDYIIKKAESNGLITSIARGGLTKKEDLEIPKIENGKGEGAAGMFEFWDENYDDLITMDEVIQYAKRFFYTIFSEEDMMELLHKVNVTELDDGYITRDEFENMNTRGADTMMFVAGKTHPKYRPRYSDQTWINQRYLRDPVLDRIIERVIKLTKLQREIIYGSERIQVVYYDKNGHYHAHFDSETHERTDIPCCHQLEEEKMKSMEYPCRLCRYITILYYLNDVEAGGETAFPVADNRTLNLSILVNSRGELDFYNLSYNCHIGNLVIRPKKGTAVMWYNHLLDEESGWMGARDEYSLHGGCDILQGEKWIANNWITAPYKEGAHIPSSWLNFF